MNILDRVIAFLGDCDADAYLVGGLVRDQLLGRAVRRDIDLAVNGEASQLAREFANENGGAYYLMDAENDVARVILEDTYVDFARLRGDVLHDLATRDLTINAMARQVGSDELIDPYRGERDLREKLIRAVGPSVFRDDPVRLLRALRLAGELGFSLAGETEDLMRGDAALMAYASMERARDEFCKILGQEDPGALLRRADDLGVLAALLPEINSLKNVLQSSPHAFDVFEHTLHVLDALVEIQARDYVDVANGEHAAELRAHFERRVSADHRRGVLLRFAALLHDVGKPPTRTVDDAGRVHFVGHEPGGARIAQAVLRRLRFSNDEIDLVTRIVREHMRPAQLAREARVSPRAAYRFFRDTGDAGVDICVLALADRRGKARRGEGEPDAPLTATNRALLDRLYRAPETVVALPVLVDGHALVRELKLAPGPRIRELLELIREAQAEGEVKTAEEALALARAAMRDAGSAGS